jgi:hypothetical protein
VEVVQFLLDNQPLYAYIQERGNNRESAISSAADTRGTRTIDYLSHQEVCLNNNEAITHLLLDRDACASDSLTRYNDHREA